MSSTTKQYTPTATARPTWREREAQKMRHQREAVARAAEEAHAKSFAKTEENFPTTIRPSDRVTIRPPGRFAELASKMQSDEDAQRRARKVRTVIYEPVIAVRSGRRTYEDEEDDFMDEEENQSLVDLNEMYPPHGKRGTYTAPDSEGWRLVTKKTRKQPRELTEAELVQKYRDTFFGEAEDGEDADHNGDLTDRNQRREFY
jgi:hypothetical protein